MKKRIYPQGKIQHLKQLTRLKKLLEREEEMDRRIGLESVKIVRPSNNSEGLPKKAQEVESKPTTATVAVPQEEAPNISPLKQNEVPEGLRGLSPGEILLLEVDNGLSESEKKWLAQQKWKYERKRHNPPDRWLH